MARSFNGTTDNISIGNQAALTPGGLSMTVCAWVKTTAINAVSRRIFSRGLSSGLAGWGFGRATANLQFSKYNVADITATGTTALTAGVWTFTAAVVKATVVRFVRISVAGALAAENVSNSGAFSGAPNNCFIGQESVNAGGASKLWAGSIGYVGVIMAQLTDSELLALALSTLPEAGGTQPTGWWPLMGDSPEPDYSGNRFSGTVTGTAVVAAPLGGTGLFTPRPGSQVQIRFPVVTSQTLPIESQIKVVGTVSDPFEGLKKVAAVGSVDPVEALVRGSSSQADPLESLIAAVKQQAVPLESLVQGAQTVSAPLESQRAATATAADTVESLVRGSGTGADPVDTLVAQAALSVLVMEASQAASTTTTDVVEANRGGAASGSDPVESITPGVAAAALVIEATRRVVASSPGVMESLGGVATLVVDPLEITGTVTAQTAAAVVESLTSGTKLAPDQVEALYTAARQAVLSVESLRADRALTEMFEESFANVVIRSSATMPIESLRRASAVVVLNIEWIQQHQIVTLELPLTARIVLPRLTLVIGDSKRTATLVDDRTAVIFVSHEGSE